MLWLIFFSFRIVVEIGGYFSHPYLKNVKPYCYQIGLLVIGFAMLLCVTVNISV